MGVKYALTVPQSVLFADLSLRGSMRSEYINAMSLNYEPEYIAIDSGGSMSWNHDNDKRFINSLVGESSVQTVVWNYIDAMGRTARVLDKVANSIESSNLRRPNNTVDIIEDLADYWRAYRAHMTSLFSFWNIEAILSQALKDAQEKNNLADNKLKNLSEYFVTDETNYFVEQRKVLQKIKRRFCNELESGDLDPSPELVAAIKDYRDKYTFLLSPFNLGSPPTINSLIESMSNISNDSDTALNKDHEYLPLEVKELAILARRLAFWKTERLDLLALADYKARNLYTEVAKQLSIPKSLLFTMTSEEILESLKTMKLVASKDVLLARQSAYCIALIKGRVSFFAPTPTKPTPIIENSSILHVDGVVASPGKTIGIVRIINSTEDLSRVKEGDVLVTKMTRPEYGVALDRAAAFVTDEGGILCHAAIIAREMGKPCIIATTNATKVLVSGMEVEVDADEGVVRVLSSATDGK